MSEEIVSWLASQREAMLSMMEKIVNIDSGSYDKAGVDTVGEVFEAFFKSHDIDVNSPAALSSASKYRQLRSDTPTTPRRCAAIHVNSSDRRLKIKAII
jgi:hypothetical protein